MATEISRSLSDIDVKVKLLNKSLRDGQQEGRELDKALKLDPKDTQALERKMRNLQTQVGQATQKVALLKQKQDEANKALQQGDITAEEFRKIELAVLRAENEVKSLNNEIRKTQDKRLGDAKKEVDGLAASFDRAEKSAQKLSKAALGIMGALAGAVTAFAVVGNELEVTSQRLGVTSEELQIQRNLFNRVTGDARKYDAALAYLNRAMTQIARGSGKQYGAALERLGVATVDSLGRQRNLNDVYSDAMLALSNLTCENERLTVATTLFGNSGMEVARVAAVGTEQMRLYNEQLIENGLITNEATAKAREINLAFEDIKQQLMAVTAELFVALMPVIETLVEIAKTTIIPILQWIAEWFAGMEEHEVRFVVFLLALLYFLPKIIKFVKGVALSVKALGIKSKVAAVGVGALSTAGAKIIIVIKLIAAAVLVLVLLFAMLAGRSRDVTGELNRQQRQFESTNRSYNNMASDMGGTVAMTSSNQNTQTMNFEVNINATGDTPISQEAAELIADTLADRINAQLGGKI